LSGLTKLLARKEHSHTFQNGEMTYEGVLKAVESSYPLVQYILHDNRQTAIHQFIAQYKETISSLKESMTVKAAESIELIQGDNKITLKDDIVVEGARMKVQ